MYHVEIIYENGNISLLEVNGRSSWKTKKIAEKHASDTRALIAKGRWSSGAITAEAIPF